MASLYPPKYKTPALLPYAREYLQYVLVRVKNSIATDIRSLENDGTETQSMASLYPPKYKTPALLPYAREYLQYVLVRVKNAPAILLYKHGK